MHPYALSLIQALIAPVVMISACGLLCLALYNRLAAIVARARTFNKERHDLQLKSAADETPPAPGSPEALEIAHRLALLDDQSGHILRRARLVRAALIALLMTVLCMLGCSLSVGVSVAPQWATAWANEAMWTSLMFYIAGIGSMAYGIILAILELVQALDPVALEWREESKLTTAGPI